MFPSLFVSHGAPTLPLDDCPARTFLTHLGETLARPKAILAVSAHWETTVPQVNSVATNDTIHDFYGFPAPLYRLQYPAPGSPSLANEVMEMLAAAGFAALPEDRQRGLDHGTWVPLMLMYPEHDIPVVQLSIQTRLGPAHHFQLGRALTALRSKILVLCTGSFTHNLRLMDRRGLDAPEPQWVRDFAAWIDSALAQHRTGDLLDYRSRAPHAVQAHPEDDHFLPLFVAVGAGGDAGQVQHLHSSTTFGTLRMDAYSFS